MWICCVFISLLPFVLLCSDQTYEKYVYEDLYSVQANTSADNSFQCTANLNLGSSSQIPTSISSNIFIEPTNNYQHQEKLLAYSVQHELIDRFLKTCTLEQFKTYIIHQKIYTTKELVSHAEWWEYQVFWDYVESLSDGHEELVTFAQH